MNRAVLLARLAAATVTGCLALGACTTPVLPPPPVSVLHDELFAAPPQGVAADGIFELSPAMQDFLQREIAGVPRHHETLDNLADALFRQDKLKLRYDSSRTRDAAQAFAARKGNCLSLVIMTAAFAKQLRLDVSYETVATDETWSRSEDLLFSNTHVNVTLRQREVESDGSQSIRRGLTIDFLPSEDLGGRYTRAISEDTLVAMYMNNRGAEALAEGRFDEAYAWVRAAIRRAPGFLPGYNSLGVVYLRHGDLAAAETAFGELIRRDSTDKMALSNLAIVEDRLGRADRARALRAQLEQLEPYPPYHFFWLGTEAFRRGDYLAARSHFKREVDRAAYNSEFHYWLGLTDLRLGDVEGARRQIAIAVENSANAADHDLYAGKLARLQSALAR